VSFLGFKINSQLQPGSLWLQLRMHRNLTNMWPNKAEQNLMFSLVDF